MLPLKLMPIRVAFRCTKPFFDKTIFVSATWAQKSRATYVAYADSVRYF